MTPDQLVARIDAEMKLLSPTEAALLRPHLVPPREIHARWQHRDKIEPCWIVADYPKAGLAVVFAEGGYGPERPWAPMWTAGPKANLISDDASWTETIIGAVFERHRARRHCCGTMALMSCPTEMAAIRNINAAAFTTHAISEPAIDFLPSSPVFLIGSMAIEFCPWCGTSLPTPPPPTP